MSAIAQLIAAVRLDSADFKKGMTDVETQTEKSKSKFSGLGKAIAGAFTIGVITKFVGEIKKMADEIIRASQEAGATSTGFQVLKNIMDDNGLSSANLGGQLAKLRTSALQAAEGNTQLQNAFANLGISMEDLDGLTSDEIFGKVSEAVANAEDSTKAYDAVIDILGTRMGATLLPTMQMVGKEGFEKLSEDARKSGEILEADFLQKVNDLEAQFNSMKRNILSWSSTALSGIQNMVDKVVYSTAVAFTTEQSFTEAWAERDKQLLQEREDRIKELTDKQREAGGLRLNIEEDLAEEIVEVVTQTAEEIKALRDAALAEEKARKEEEKRLAKEFADEIKRLEAARKAYSDAQAKSDWEQMSTKERLAELEKTRFALIQSISWFEQHAAELSIADQTEMLKQKTMLLQLEADMEKMYRETGKRLEETAGKQKTLSEDQLEVSKNLQKFLRNMSDAELKDFLGKLEKISAALEGMDLTELEGLRWLGSFKFNGVSVGQAAQMAQALTELADGIEGLQLPNLAGLEHLGGFEFKSVTPGQARQMALALQDLSKGLKGVTIPDLEGLNTLRDWKLPDTTPGQARQFARAIVDLVTTLANTPIDLEPIQKLQDLFDAIGGEKIELVIKAPPAEQMVLTVDQGYSNAMESLAASAKIIAGFKGVICA